ncbi:MAG: TetR family transcriptional regulator [Actinomycetia bacterium]|nr:TetR family transcriptional regulator [Actinomycetes bacterium]
MLVSTRGFRDLGETGRINRPDALNFRFRKHEPVVPRRDRIEVRERCLWDGRKAPRRRGSPAVGSGVQGAAGIVPERPAARQAETTEAMGGEDLVMTANDSPVAQIKSRIDAPTLLAWRRRQLVEAATALFDERGFAGTRLEDIAARVGLSSGALYRYIGRKEDLLLLILDDLFKAYERALAVDPGDCLRRLKEAISRYYTVVHTEQRKVLVGYRESKHLQPTEREWAKQRELATNLGFQQIIAEGIAAGVFRDGDPSVAAFSIVMGAHMWALKNWYFRERWTIEAYIAAQTDLLLEGLVRRA